MCWLLGCMWFLCEWGACSLHCFNLCCDNISVLSSALGRTFLRLFLRQSSHQENAKKQHNLKEQKRSKAALFGGSFCEYFAHACGRGRNYFETRPAILATGFLLFCLACYWREDFKHFKQLESDHQGLPWKLLDIRFLWMSSTSSTQFPAYESWDVSVSSDTWPQLGPSAQSIVHDMPRASP